MTDDSRLPTSNQIAEEFVARLERAHSQSRPLIIDWEFACRVRDGLSKVERLRERISTAASHLDVGDPSQASRVLENALSGDGSSAPETSPNVWKRMCDEAPVNDGRMIWWDYGNGGKPVLTKAADFYRTDGGYWAEAVPPTRPVVETEPSDESLI